MDARVGGTIPGRMAFPKFLQLYPEGLSLGRYGGKFIPQQLVLIKCSISSPIRMVKSSNICPI